MRSQHTIPRALRRRGKSAPGRKHSPTANTDFTGLRLILG
jgi:hypothetical protein